MLTSDLVRVRKKGKELSVVGLAGKARQRALELAERYDGLVRSHEALTYGELREAFTTVEVGPRDKKLALGLIKLIEDQLELDAQAEVDPQALRAAVFAEAAALRRERPREFERLAVFARAQAELGLQALTIETIEEALFADLKSEKRVRYSPKLSPTALVDSYELAQHQAVLLRATRVRARVRCASVAGYRSLFRALKFRRLLYTLQKDGDAYELDIDGPFSLFESVTKYGLQLALLFPALLACDELSLTADVRWGKQREALVFRYQGERSRDVEPVAVHPDVDDLLERLSGLSEWQVRLNDELVDLPGVGLVAPDLVFTRGTERIFLELLGYWSRDAVWKRVELVEKGLGAKIVFAVSSRLRVSEAVLEESALGALYVFKGTPSPKKVLEKVTALAAKAGKGSHKASAGKKGPSGLGGLG
jgi:uncharacterized protein